MISHTAKITIVGLGLLGGSYAKGFFQAGYPVYGIDIDENAVEYARKMHWVKDASTDPAFCEGSDIIISALYPHTFIQWVKENQAYFKPGTVLTDVTGIKREVISEIGSFLRKDVEYIACHPMAGREYKGIRYADCSLFKKANFIIVPSKENTERAIGVAEDIANILKFRKVSVLSPEEHDRVIGFVSQLTHVIAISLMNIGEDPKLVDYTGDSFRDLTRIANINEDLWPELFICNKDVLTEEIDRLIAKLKDYRDWIENEETEKMRAGMIEASERRKLFGRK
ncbi:MAG: prephenate dehydrogenase [Erysipelotrichales bacterium]|nr:prephenate dehydrogenase [Erysipelotrichales bacterium]MBQ2477888.1 prephenate dehydrogenase [Erysipelotrichales bacterium]MBQ4374445.1 prephenate dehydrogenase [Erysipelotrichales bacterium]MBQ5541725.1 prephenate dehydrogenase [Erysipelotrichales bacterium]